jgi:hypothetical protein
MFFKRIVVYSKIMTCEWRFRWDYEIIARCQFLECRVSAGVIRIWDSPSVVPLLTEHLCGVTVGCESESDQRNKKRVQNVGR